MASFSGSSRSGKADILRNGPNRFTGSFPKNDENRSFQSSWYDRYKWVEFNAETGGAQCFYCKLLKPVASKNDGFRAGLVRNWRKFVEKANQHEQSMDHKRCYTDATEIIAAEARQDDTLPAKLTKASEQEKERNRKGIKIMFSIVRWIATQNIAFRGHGDGTEGNFRCFVETFRPFMPDLDSFLASCPKNATYMSWKIQNEFIQIIDELVVDEILKPIIRDKKPFSVIMDETTDSSTKLQVAVSVRYTNSSGTPEEHLIAMIESPSSTGEALSNLLLKILKLRGLSMDQLVGQGYDGGSNMRGDINGVQGLIRAKCPQALYTWCWSHSLQLVMSHTADGSSAAVDCFNKMKEVYSAVSSSAHRTHIMEQHLLKEDFPADEDSQQQEVSSMALSY